MLSQLNSKERKFNEIILSGKLLRILLSVLCLVAIFISTNFLITTQAGNKNSESGITLSTLTPTLSLINGQTTKLEIKIERNNYFEPVELYVIDLPEGMEITFDKNPIDGDTATAWIYSPMGEMPPLNERESQIKMKSDTGAELKVRIHINCGIDWVEQFGTSSGDGDHNDYDKGSDVTVDNNDNIYVVGRTFGAIDIYNENQGSSDVWLAKYDLYDNQKWIRQLGGLGEDFVSEVVVDNSGGVFIGGFTHQEMPGNTSQGNLDYWVAKYDDSGNFEWVSQFGTNGQDGKYGLNIIPDGNGGGTLITLTQERNFISTISFDSNGNFNIGTSSSVAVPSLFTKLPRDMAIGPSGEVVLVGFSINNGINRESIIKFDSSGNQEWNMLGVVQPFDRQTSRVVIDSAGDIYVSGEDFNGGISSAWIAKYDGTNGNRIWRKTENSSNNDLIRTIGVNSFGDLIIAGTTEGVLGERNGGVGNTEDAWVSRRNASDGELVWVRQFPVANADSFNAVAFDSQGGIILSGYSTSWKNPQGNKDALLMRYVDMLPRYSLTPTITGLTPGSGSVGDTIKINGTNFVGFTGVRFDGVPTTFNVNSPHEIETVVPQGVPSGQVRVTLSSGCQTFSGQTQFTVN